MQYLREIYTLLTDMNMIEEEIRSQAHHKFGCQTDHKMVDTAFDKTVMG